MITFPEYEFDVWGCDYGSSMFHVCCNGDPNTYRRIEPTDFIRLLFAQPGDVVLIELAHVQPQKEKALSSISLSQGLTYANLVALQQQTQLREINLRIAPHSLTPRIRHEIFPGQDKSDNIDAASVCYFFPYYGLNGLQRFAPRPADTWTDRQRLAFEIKAETDAILNYFRGHSGDLPALRKQPLIAQFLSNAGRINDCKWGMFTDVSGLSDAQRHTYAIHVEKWIYGGGGKKMKPHSENSVLFSLWASVFDLNGEKRRHPATGELLGINFLWKDVLGNRPNHFRGGVARSNVMYYGFKARVLPARLRKHDGMKIGINPGNSKRQELNAFRREYAVICRTVMRQMQELNL